MSLHPPVCALCRRASGQLVHAACFAEAQKRSEEKQGRARAATAQQSPQPAEAKQFAWWDLTRLFPDPTAPLDPSALRPVTFPLPNPANFHVPGDLSATDDDDALL